MNTEKYEQILKDRQREIFARLHKIDTDLGNPRDKDSEEQATEAENDEVLEEFGQVGEKELKAIDAALERISMGTFGICAKCGQPIAEARLDAVPSAALCQECAAGE
ncbi:MULTISPECIES: TraR/DksA family transcriptional regulator [Alphaproteobacteria]|uniref:Dimethylmenaquinone methyltransferase n=2 Tax=Alphaproteobacteria TaxID=28211 RepID=A0A512HFS8_9HYPH|nr:MULTISPECIES: TraR/DksA C4-type zinc finger protein [Alphaproteobacteria]GEO84303.1 dimethylmenaquinone methyltransferase [Ciceribacter naphthalenivorans]GLR24839.1 dimethylmenaquinone methyltransferase [Ciceribacter naphthalenivorans]GLT07695.1 dimethylmenaquinone methyltransferase [Sphingomonas psychrolutea]